MTLFNNKLEMQNIKDSVESFFKAQNTRIEKTTEQTSTIIKIINELVKARKKGNRIFTMGNGGSGSTASHFVSDLLKTAITKEEKRFKAISLTDNIPVILAWANDVSYEDIFVEQLKNHLLKGDVVFGFSGSGKSKNVLKAFEYAKNMGAVCIGITGKKGGEFPKICDIYLIVPSDDMLLIESIHVMLCHCIVAAIRKTGRPIFRYE